MIYTYGCVIEGISTCQKEDVYEYFRNKSSMAVDTEATGKNPHKDVILSLQLGDGENQFFIDCRDGKLEEFKELLEEKECILQNAKFDYQMLKVQGIIMEKIWDVMLAECVLYCGWDKWGYSLDVLVRRYIGRELEKETRKSFIEQGNKAFTEQQARYGCLDVAYLHEIRAKQEILLKEKDLERTHALENQVVKAFGDIEYNGMGFDEKEWLAIASQTQIEAQNLEEELDHVILTDEKLGPIYKPEYVQPSLFGEEQRQVRVNYASPAQISKICTQLGCETDSTDEKHLKRLKNKHTFFSKLLDLRKKNKILSTYGESFLKYIRPETGRVHTSFWQIVETGRTSSGSKADNAPNTQNIPRKGGFKKCFKARPGFRWVSSDYSGQEARIMASASQDEGLMAILNSDEDIHCSVGSMMFKKTITKQDEEERYLAKTVNFMVPYGAASQKLADEMDISEEEAAKLLKLHAEAFPQLHMWLQNMGRHAKRHEYSLTIGPIGRKRFYPDMKEAKALRKKVVYGDKATWKRIFIIEGQTERNGGNSPIQGGAADMSKEALVAVRTLIQQYNSIYGEDVAFLLGMVHDSIECEVRENLAEEFGEEMNQIMVDVANRYLTGVKMKVDTTISLSWGK